MNYDGASNARSRRRLAAPQLAAGHRLPLLWTDAVPVDARVASFRPAASEAQRPMASLVPNYLPTLANFSEALDTGDFPLYYVNTAIMCGGILAVQIRDHVARRLTPSPGWNSPAATCSSISSCCS